MIIFDEIKDKNKLSLWWNKMLVDVKHSYPMINFSQLDKNFKMDVAVDVGCNIGCFSYIASAHFKKVISFEPGYYTSVVARMRLNQKEKLNNVFVHNLAVGENTGDVLKLSCASYNGELNSGNASTTYVSDDDKYELVTTISLEKVFELSETQFIDYLKIDCEGAEYAILMNKDLSNIGIMAGEIHRHPNKDFDTARRELLQHLSTNFSISCTKHNFFAVNKRFNFDANSLFFGDSYET